MEGRYGVYSQGSSGWTSWRNEELREEDVWGVFKEREDFNSKVGPSKFSTITPRRLPSAAQMIPRAPNNTAQEPKLVQQSAPVQVPDWSKIYGKKTSKESPSKNVSWLDDGVKGGWNSDDDDEDDDDDDDGNDSDGNMMPPHEWIARKHARSQVSSFSVCEGAGRTLKGRDLSKVRNAVLSRTGFLE